MSQQNHSRLQRKNMLRLVAIVFLLYQSVLSPLTYAFYEYETTWETIVQDTADSESDIRITVPSFPNQEVVWTPDAWPLPEAWEAEDYLTWIDELLTGSDVITWENAASTWWWDSTWWWEDFPSEPIVSANEDAVASWWVWSGETPILTPPEVVIPTGSLTVDTYWRFFLNSVESVEVVSDDISFCSLVARKNIERLTSVLHIQSPLISRGDAMTLIEEWIQDKTPEHKQQNFSYSLQNMSCVERQIFLLPRLIKILILLIHLSKSSLF